jgi:hypothetical protein
MGPQRQLCVEARYEGVARVLKAGTQLSSRLRVLSCTIKYTMLTSSWRACTIVILYAFGLSVTGGDRAPVECVSEIVRDARQLFYLSRYELFCFVGGVENFLSEWPSP